MSGLGRIAPALAAFVVAALALAVARTAMLPGLAFWDTAELQAVGPLMGTAHPAGFPTYVLLGWLGSVLLQPFGDPAFRMNLLAGLCLAAAAGLTVDLARALTRSTFLGILAGVGLALTPVAWAIGTHAEAHALHLVLAALLLRLLVAWQARVSGSVPGSADRWLVAAAIVFGLSVGNHSLTLLLALPVALFVLAANRATLRNTSLVALCLAACTATVVLVYLELPLRAGPFRAPLVYGRPETWDGFWYVVLGEQFRGNVVSPFSDLGGMLGALVDRTVDQFGILAPLLPLAYLAALARWRAYALLTGSAVLITVLFAASYENADIGRYYLGPVLMAWTWLAILGATAAGWAARLLETFAGWRPPGALGGALVAAVLLAPSLLTAPATFDLVDRSRDREAVAWVDHTLEAMPPGSVIVSWWSYSTPLWYAQRVEGRRPDVVIVDDRTRLDEGLGDITDVIDSYLATNPVFVIRQDEVEADLLAERYVLEPIDGPDARWLMRVVAARAGA